MTHPASQYESAKAGALRSLNLMPDDIARDRARRMIEAVVLSDYSRGIVDAGREYLGKAVMTDCERTIRECYLNLMPAQQLARAKRILDKTFRGYKSFAPEQLAAEIAMAEEIVARESAKKLGVSRQYIGSFKAEYAQ